MDTRKLAVSLTTAFALAVGAGNAAAEPQATPAQIADFNNHTKDAVLLRNVNRDIRNEPILIKETNGRYLVHEASNMFGAFNGDGVGKLASYSKEELTKKFGPVENIRTYEEYRADANILKKTPGLGSKLSDNSIDMGTRLKDVQSDMKAAGETFTQPVRKNKFGPSN
jgi:hypothetical protein